MWKGLLNFAKRKLREARVSAEMRHLFGPVRIPGPDSRPAVVCLVKDAEPFVRSFIEHHLGIGFGHVVFVDNGSTDRTLDIVGEYPDVTVFQCDLSFQEYKIPLRKWAMRRYGAGRWLLNADIDEHFDYPCSNRLGLDGLMAYLDSRGYTAMVTQMLDLFPDMVLDPSPEASADFDPNEHRFYDLSDLERLPYWSGDGNEIPDADLRVHRGGIHRTLFGTGPCLTKHALFRMDGDVDPQPGSEHRIEGAKVADVTGVLLHYKFLGDFYQRARRIVEENQYYMDSVVYRRAVDTIEEEGGLSLRRSSARELRDVDQLVREGFLVASDDYLDWVGNHAEKARVPAAQGR